MELKPGYKQTEVGVIPEDWEVIPLISCLSSTPNYGINAPAVPYSDRLPAYIRITDISEDGQFLSHNPVSVKSINAAKYFLSDGDIVFARTGASVGKSYRYKLADGSLVFAGFLIRVHPDPTKLLPSFVAAYVTTGNYLRWVSLMSMRSGQPGINGKEYSLLPIPKPPLPEQRSIATALSDMDELLGGLDRLITKKRDLKQSAMQQLITGKTRLPEFDKKKGYKQTELGLIPENWEVKPLIEIVDFLDGCRRPIKDSDRAKMRGDIPYYGASGVVDYVNAHLFDEDLILLGEDGENILSRNCRLAFKISGKTWVNNHAHVLKPKPTMELDYLVEFLESQNYEQYNTGTAQPKLNKAVCSGLQILCPPLLEQIAIASILSDMDTEIATLERRRNKTRDLKQAMMQELLTGRIRLL